MLRTNPLIALACALSVFACNNGPSQHDPARYGNVRVGVSTQLSDPNRLIDNALNRLDALGPDFVRTDTSNAQITIEPEPTPTVFPPAPCQDYLRYNVDTKTIYIDQRCLQLDTRYHQGIVLGISQLMGRIVGMKVICRPEQDSPECSEVGYGVALMNSSPSNRFPSSGEFQNAINVVNEITELDLAEYRLHGHPL